MLSKSTPFRKVPSGTRAIRAILSIVICTLPYPSLAQKAHGIVPGRGAGQRINQTDMSSEGGPTGRISNRLQTRIDGRLNNRIAADSNPQSNVMRQNLLRSYKQTLKTNVRTSASISESQN